VNSSLSSDSQTGSVVAGPIDRARLKWLGHTFKQYGIIVAFLAICAVLALLNPVFVSPGNISNVLLQTTINGILSLGMTLVILTGGIDLSVGSTLGISGIFGALIVSGDHPIPTLIAVPLVLLFGALIGWINGTLVTTLKIPAFVTTLGMLSVGRGFAQILANGYPVPNSYEYKDPAANPHMDSAYTWIGQGHFGVVPVPVVIFLVVFLALWLVLSRTTYGRYIYAVGGNEKSARTAGVSTRLIKASTYVICGMLAAVAAVILTARNGSANPGNDGVTYELNAIAAVVIGGTSLSGGVGSVYGTLFGALILGVIDNGLDLQGVSDFYKQVFQGGIIILAVLLDWKRLQRD
jgi:putative xylitol transport system permease protein